MVLGGREVVENRTGTFSHCKVKCVFRSDLTVDSIGGDFLADERKPNSCRCAEKSAKRRELSKNKNTGTLAGALKT